MRDLRNMINNEVIIQTKKTLDTGDQWSVAILFTRAILHQLVMNALFICSVWAQIFITFNDNGVVITVRTCGLLQT